MKSFMQSVKASMDITGVVVDVVLVTALIPVIATFITNATNISATERTILSLTTLFIVLALVFNIAQQSGLIKKN